ncbi:MAG: helix-turn-helix domain-containing protein [Gammaproteobacteria bacterium]|nr:helix-turn-helix domain-containing protein [Gammaproteobacteria bacterium]
MNKKTPNSTHILNKVDADSLLDEIRQRLTKAQKDAAMAAQAASFSPIEEAGLRIRAERKKQGLTLNDLCELSGVAYATLNKIEHGHPSARLDSVGNVARALGMKLWIG